MDQEEAAAARARCREAASMGARGGEEQLVWGSGGNKDAGAAGCLCPAAARGPLFPREELEQEVLRRVDLQGGDRRGERRMKNRESAARSRARRHAYVNELEKEVSLLQAENDELRKLCEELKEAAEVAVPVAVTSRGGRAPAPQRPSCCGGRPPRHSSTCLRVHPYPIFFRCCGLERRGVGRPFPCGAGAERIKEDRYGKRRFLKHTTFWEEADVVVP